MIKQEIVRYKDYTFPQYTPVQHQSAPPFAKLSKWGFTEYLKKLTLKKGDLVCMKVAFRPLTDWNIYEVEDIQEIWYMVEMGGPTIGPMCLRLRAKNGNRFSGGGEQYEKVKPDEITEYWREHLQAKWAVANNVVDI